MEAIVERAAGLDVHQGSVVACVVIGAPGHRPVRETRSFGTMSRDLAALREWLLGMGVTHVGMESTGVYWQPVHAALEGDFTVIVGNASHMRNVPGRKTDRTDAEWIADLVRHGLVRASFVPPAEIRVLRELIRHRKALAGGLASERNRTLKLLEGANIKLAGVVSDVFGVSGMLMLKALAEGNAEPAEMAAVTSVAVRCVLPLRVPRRFCLPALAWFAGQTPAQAARRWAVPKPSMSTPISAMMAAAVSSLTPGMVQSRACCAAKGCMAAPIAASTSAMSRSISSSRRMCIRSSRR